MSLRCPRFPLAVCLSVACWALLAPVVRARAEGLSLNGSFLDNPRLRAGFFQGDPSVSLIQTSPYALASYAWGSDTDLWFGGVEAGLGAATLNQGRPRWQPLALLSERAQFGAKFTLGPTWRSFVAVTQDLLGSAYWGRLDDPYRAYAGDLLAEFVPVSGAAIEAGDGLQVLLGAGSRMLLDQEDVQNADWGRLHLYPYAGFAEGRLRIRGGTEIGVDYLATALQATLGLGASQEVNGLGAVNARGAWAHTFSPLYPEEREVSAGLALPMAGGTLEAGVTLNSRKFAVEDRFSPEWLLDVKLTLPLGPGALDFTLSQRAFTTDPYSRNAGTDYYSFPNYTSAYLQFEGPVVGALRTLGPDEFIAYLRSRNLTPLQAVWLASVIGGRVGEHNYNYGTGSADRDLINSATFDQIYLALQQSLNTGTPQPVTVCRGLHRFVSELVGRVDVPGVTAYTSWVSRDLEGHVISFLSTPDQIYLIDYWQIIPTRTLRIGSALQVWQNLKSAPVPVQSIYGADGKLLALVTTADGQLLQDTLTIQAGGLGEATLGGLFERVFPNKP